MDLIRRYSSALRFLLVGGLSFAVDYGLLLISYRIFRLSLNEATDIGFFTGLIVNFGLNKYWTFSAMTKGQSKTARQIVLYGLLVGLNLFLTYCVVMAFASQGVGPELSKPVATTGIMMLNYCAYRWIIFKPPNLVN